MRQKLSITPKSVTTQCPLNAVLCALQRKNCRVGAPNTVNAIVQPYLSRPAHQILDISPNLCLPADNLWALKGWCRKSFEGMEADMEAFFKSNGYSEDMDYV